MYMKNYRKNVLKKLILVSFLTLSFNTYSASFDCSKAKTSIEEMICKTEVLSNLDSSMASLYKEKKDSKLIELQKVWLSNVRNKATTVDELTVLYSERIKFLSEYNPEKLKINNQLSNRNSDKLK
ncbi:lysozyme inhibitor LprI family protein, partial [Proteus mirabilis]